MSLTFTANQPPIPSHVPSFITNEMESKTKVNPKIVINYEYWNDDYLLTYIIPKHTPLIINKDEFETFFNESLRHMNMALCIYWNILFAIIVVSLAINSSTTNYTINIWITLLFVYATMILLLYKFELESSPEAIVYILENFESYTLTLYENKIHCDLIKEEIVQWLLNYLKK